MQKHGVDRFLELLGNATDIFDFALKEWAGDVSQLTGREKSERVEGFVPLLGAVTDPVVRNDAAQRIADAFRLEFETVWSRVRGKASAPRRVERQRRMPRRLGGEDDPGGGASGEAVAGGGGAAAGGALRRPGVQNALFYHEK